MHGVHINSQCENIHEQQYYISLQSWAVISITLPVKYIYKVHPSEIIIHSGLFLLFPDRTVQAPPKQHPTTHWNELSNPHTSMFLTKNVPLVETRGGFAKQDDEEL